MNYASKQNRLDSIRSDNRIHFGESFKGLNVDLAIYLSSTSSLFLISSRTESCMLLISESVNVLSIDRYVIL